MYFFLMHPHDIDLHRRELQLLRDSQDPYRLPTRHFVKLFRIQKDMARDLIPQLEPYAWQTGEPFTLKFLGAIHYFGHGLFQPSVGFLLGLTRTKTRRAVREVCYILNTHFKNLYFPSSVPAVAAAKHGFIKYGLPDVIASVGSCHVAITTPPHTKNAGLYKCNKGFYSIHVLVACDANLIISYANARFPGSVCETAIWNTSKIKRHFEEQFEGVPKQNRFVIGDEGFPLEPWMLTPCDDPKPDSPEAKYNKCVMWANNVETCFKMVKNRFKCMKKLYCKPIKASFIIYAVLRLHNVFRQRNAPSVSDDEDEPGNDSSDSDSDSSDGSQEEDSDSEESREYARMCQLGTSARNLYIQKHFSKKAKKE